MDYSLPGSSVHVFFFPFYQNFFLNQFQEVWFVFYLLFLAVLDLAALHRLSLVAASGPTLLWCAGLLWGLRWLQNTGSGWAGLSSCSMQAQ